MSRGNERGMALVAVLLLLMTISALGAALAISGNTETLIARNHQNAAEARATADAGLSHALALTLDFVNDWQGTYASASAAMTALIADPSLGDLDPLVAGVTGFDTLGDVDYQVAILDDDDEAGRDINLDADALVRMGEDGDEATDVNSKLVVRATGYAAGNAVAVIEATVAELELPAFLTNGDLEIDGNFDLSGSHGSVHTNSDVDISGGAWATSQGCTASGASDDTDCPGGAQRIAAPDRRASDYRHLATWVLKADGSITDVNDNACTVCPDGWDFDSGVWELDGDPSDGTYYVEGDVELGRNETGTVTIIAEGSIDVSSGPTFLPHTAGLLLVTDEDLDMAGNSTFGNDANEGLILVREQIDIGGNVEIHGQIIVLDAAANNGLVTANRSHGGVEIEYNGGIGNMFYGVSAWRRSN